MSRTTFSNSKVSSLFTLTIRDNHNTPSITRFLTILAHEKINRSAKIWLIVIPALVFSVSLFFGLLHHFYRYVWAGTIWYYTAMLLAVVIALELFLIAFEH